MNWNKIKEKYPKALLSWLGWKYGVDSLGDWEVIASICLGKSDTRFLYDFFDEQGIYISLHHLEDEFVYEIEDGKDLNSSGEYESTRTEAETRAFEKAFEILENK